MIRPLSTEQWADVATLTIVAVAFLVMLFFELKRTWRWDSLGRALTILTGCLLVSHSLSVVSLLTTLDIWVPALRWTIRVTIAVSGIWVIIVLALDRPPAKDGAR